MSQLNAPATDLSGPYILHSILDGIPLSEDGSQKGLSITCVEFWDGNLYIGTSAAEILHYVLIPAGSDPDEKAQFILATRLPLSTNDSAPPSTSQTGVQRIVVLPSVGKACILCNGNVTFHTLPELSPTFTGTKLGNCSWIGGIDLDESIDDAANPDGVVIAICGKTRVRLVRVGERPTKVREGEVDVAGCTAFVRRGDIACFADAQSYSLLDVVQRQRIPLSDISSAREDEEKWNSQQPSGRVSPETPAGTNSLDTAAVEGDTRPRDASPGAIGQQTVHLDANAPGFPPRGSSLQVPRPTSPQRRPSSTGGRSDDSRASSVRAQARTGRNTITKLRANIVSPTPNEFLFTTGTSTNEPGVGMFVNLDGDVIRGTLEFSQYPDAICIDLVSSAGSTSPIDAGKNPEGFVLAIMDKAEGDCVSRVLEIQNWNPEFVGGKHWLEIPDTKSKQDESQGAQVSAPVGIRSAMTSTDVVNTDIAEILGQRRLVLGLRSPLPSTSKTVISEVRAKREKTEAQFIARLSAVSAKVLVWHASCLWWAVRNPSLVRFDARLTKAVGSGPGNVQSGVDSRVIQAIFQEISVLDPQTELEFLGFKYIRQRASLLLFIDSVKLLIQDKYPNEDAAQLAERAISEGEIDPRIVLAILPVLRHEVVEGPHGIWVPNGLKELVEEFIREHDLFSTLDVSDEKSVSLLLFARRYLQSWRRKKGFGSIADEAQVFHSVDAALLHTLLLLDSTTSKGPAIKGSIRSEINTLVDHGVDCGDRALELLESFKRLYVLSRLYQGWKMPAKVLATWRRIVEGEEDAAGQFSDGEQEIGRYLTRLSDAALVEEYGAWLAARNAALGVRVFADNNSKVKFAPARVVEILRQRAPDAVKAFLEHLVFDKHLAAYADDLIYYYLDSVLSTLAASSDARRFLLSTYSTYRSLHPPKPPYTAFAADNALPDAWYANRLRLLQLLGGSDVTASQFDVEAILERLTPFEQELIPEMIVLRGRQGRHEDAIHLLAQGLGDFDTAVSYCILGGASIYSTSTAGNASVSRTTPSREQQASLFSALLTEFLSISDEDDRVAQTGELLSRFAPWFDITDVLSKVPEEWTLDVLTGFLESAMRRLVTEKRETTIQRALVGAENLVANADLVEKIERAGPSFDTGDAHITGAQ